MSACLPDIESNYKGPIQRLESTFISQLSYWLEPERYHVLHARYTSKPRSMHYILLPMLYLRQYSVLHGQMIDSVQGNASWPTSNRNHASSNLTWLLTGIHGQTMYIGKWPGKTGCYLMWTMHSQSCKADSL